MVEASGTPKTPQFATGALGAPKANITNKSVTYEWSGRPDSNWRPPAPKAVSGLSRKCPIFNCLRFKQMARTCCNLWSLVEPGGSRQLHFYLQQELLARGQRAGRSPWTVRSISRRRPHIGQFATECLGKYGWCKPAHVRRSLGVPGLKFASHSEE